MSRAHMNKEELVKRIDESFGEGQYPGDQNLFVEIYDPDINSFMEILRQKTWKQTLNILEALEGPGFYFYHSMFSFMTNDALYYFMPAFLIISLDPKADKVESYFFMSLTPNSHNEYQNNRFKDLIQRLSLQQKNTIAQVVMYLYEESEYNKEIRDYWSSWLTIGE